MSLEDQLSGWTGPASDTEKDKQDRTERMIRQAIDSHDPFNDCSLKVYAVVIGGPKMSFQNPLIQLSRLLIALSACAVAGCASGPKILTDYDRDANFGAYNTYNFVEGAGPDYEGYDSLFTKFVIQAVTIEMEKRGYTKSDNPDLLVNFGAKFDDKIDVRTTSAPMTGGYYGYRRGAYGYGGWGGYGYATETNVSQYTEGTYNIDIIDNKRRQLVWEAVGIGRITDKKRKNLEETVRIGVPIYFSGYPFVAGNPNPVTEQ